MQKSNWFRLALFGVFPPLAFLALLLFLTVDAAALQAAEMTPATKMPAGEPDSSGLYDGWKWSDADQFLAAPQAAAEVITPTTLSVTILSTPWAALDSNKPGGAPNDPAPNVFIVEAVVTNTGDYDAVDLEVLLDYNEEGDWQLLENEDPLRTPGGNLAPGDAFYSYWFATYPVTHTPSQSHQYTVTASAELVDPVSTSVNAFETPAPGATVATDSFLSTGSSGVTQISTNIVVGVVYAITVTYDLGTNPQFLILSPVGNPEFDAGTSRLLASSIRLYNSDGDETFIYDRLYLPSIPDLADGNPPDFAEITYTLLPVTPAVTEMCSYAAIGYGSQQKYDQFYCEEGTTIIIEGGLSFAMTKSVDKDFVQQDGILTYTINYTNNGTVPIQHVWLWDEVDPAVASIIDGTAVPAPVASESDAHRVVWYLGELAAAGQPGSTGTHTFQALMDGGGADLADGTEALNTALLGINPGSLPPLPALTATTTSMVQAPSISLAKSDGLETTGNGEALTYTLAVANNGSVAATNLVLTDILPAEVTLSGSPTPPPDDTQGQQLVWTTLGDLAPGDELTITVPVSVGLETPSFVDLINEATLRYGNGLGHIYDLQSASDTTTLLRRAGFVEGYAFVDGDGDGIFDGDEVGLDGVQISLPAALTPTATTDSEGYYRFRIEVEEPISVTADVPVGYFRTTPGTIHLVNTFEATKTVNFGYASTESDFGVVYGTVFDDENHDGLQGGGEIGLPGVTISSTAVFSISGPVETSEYGQYSVPFEGEGTVTLEETNPAGYVSTTPDVVQVEVQSGSSQGSPVDFGDYMGVKVEGRVFDDLNANGQDDSEPGLAGAQVSLSSGMSTLTGPSGDYLLYGPPGETITITEQNPADYVSTGAIPGSGASYFDDDTLVVAAPTAGQVYDGNLFGDVLPADLAITKSAEPDPVAAGGIITYTLTYSNLGPSEALTVTIVDTLPDNVSFLEIIEENPATDGFDQDGQILTWDLDSLANGQGGSIVFTAQVNPDAIGAVHNEVEIGSATADFEPANDTDETDTAIGSPDQATIYGYVFEDLNINGEFDGDDSGIENVEVWLDDTYSTTTDVDGLYFFITDIVGTHKVVEVDPENHISTTPNKRVVTVSLGDSVRADFGDAPDNLEAAAIYGTVFHDEDSSETWDDDEVGLEGVTITLNGSLTLTTDIYGGYTFSVTAGGTYTVQETDLPDYFSTTPNTVSVEVDLGNGYERNFGDLYAVGATCDPDQFEDDDDYLNAKELTFGQWQRHDFCDDAVDWITFEAQAGSIYTMTTSSFDQRTDTYIALYDVDGQTLIAANDDLPGTTDFSSQLQWQATDSGSYYVRTTNMSQVTGLHTEYDIQIAEKPFNYIYLPLVVSPAAAKDAVFEKPFRHAAVIAELLLPDPDGIDGPQADIIHMCPDAYEVDDHWQTAAVVDHGDVQVHSFDSNPIVYAADKDYLGFTLKANQTITITITVMTNTLTALEAFDEHGQSMGLNGADQLAFTTPTAGQFYVSVSPQSADAFGCANEVGYEVSVEKSPRWDIYVPVVAKPD